MTSLWFQINEAYDGIAGLAVVMIRYASKLILLT